MHVVILETLMMMRTLIVMIVIMMMRTMIMIIMHFTGAKCLWQFFLTGLAWYWQRMFDRCRLDIRCVSRYIMHGASGNDWYTGQKAAKLATQFATGSVT